MKSRLHAATAGFATLAAAVGIVMAGGAVASAAAPPFEPDPQAVGTITFYDASGNVITGGSSSASPFFAYAVGSTTVRAGDVQATVNAANPDPAQPTTSWFVDQLGGFTPYPVTTGPAAIQTLSQSHPVARGVAGDSTLDDFYAESVHNTGTGYTNVIQLRMITANSGGQQTTQYDSADVLINPAAHTFQVIYPTPVTATTTTLVASPSPASVGQTVTLTATESPAVAGSVQFKDGATNIGSAAAVNGSGVATTTTSTLAQGSHNLSAVFTPTDTTVNAGSTGTATLVVNPPATPTTTSLAVTQDSVAGDPATLTATVTGPGATPNNAGTVSFFDNSSSTALNASPVTGSGGVYTLNLPTGFSAGGHSIVAKFTPTDVTTFQVSQSAPQSFLTQPPATGPCDPAAGGKCTDVQNIQATVPTGTLVISTPYTPTHPLDLGTLALDPTSTEFTGSAPFQNIVVTDTRSGGLGYTVTALSSPLSDGGSHPNSTISAQNVGLTGLVATANAGFTGTVAVSSNPAASPPVGPTAPGSLGLGGTAPHTAFAVTGSGNGTVTVNGVLTLNVPTSTEAGLFQGTITFTVG